MGKRKHKLAKPTRKKLKRDISAMRLQIREMLAVDPKPPLDEFLAIHSEIERIRLRLGFSEKKNLRSRRDLIDRWHGHYVPTKGSRRRPDQKLPLQWAKKPVIPMSAAEVEQLRAMSYGDYLESKYWQRVRMALYVFRGSRCESCRKSRTILDVHHLTYERRGCEWPIDLVILCRECHGDRHNTVLPGGSRSAGRAHQNAMSRSQ